MRLPSLATCAFVVAAFLSFPAAADLVGKYSVAGKEPAGGGQYTGEAVVAKEGATYHVIWTIGGQVAIGTGILTEDVFAVTYVIRGTRVPGIALYKVGGDGSLIGRFTMLGVNTIGDESWAPLGR